MSTARIALILTTAWLLQACAASPKPSPNAAAPVNAPARASANAKTNQPPPLDPELAEAAKGYDRAYVKGEWQFCKRERPIGSNLFTTVCVTEAQLRARAQDTRLINEERARKRN